MPQEYYAIDLPGKILYDKEFSISVRRITPIEQKFILSLSQKEQKTNRDYINFIKKLISIDNPEMTFEELYWFDIQYILYKIRFTTYEKYPIKLIFKCKGYDEIEHKPCNERIEKELNIGDMIINTPDDLPNLTRKITLDNLGEVDIRNKIIKDDLEIDDFIKANRLDGNDTMTRLLLLDLCLIKGNKSLFEMYKLAEDGTLTASDIVAIEKWFTDNIWGVREEMTVVCPKCGKEEVRGYSLSLEDFFSAI
ncbi:MAG: hypothetical protein IKO49_02030 [Bacilli bacterium]|nr:hypothetical protein [Clostridia bacterium]MBR4618059.1 hypothetical protein [Bacilli bacterium]